MKKNSEQGHFSFLISDDSWRNNNAREGENKLSKTVLFGEDIKKCKYLIIGISEDIGPQMNNGLPGANIGFKSFVSAIQNVQSNDFFDRNEIGFIGEIIQNHDFKSESESKGWVEELDQFLYEIVQNNSSSSQIIIAIGGGHNNAYPLLKNVKTSTNKSIHSINIDPHADCRITDKRHSGNPFSYALNDGYLDKYSLIGLHESYNNQFILDFIHKEKIETIYFENFLDDEAIFWKSVDSIAESFNENFAYTLDLDLDSIAFAPSSALTPSGFSIEDCRRLIRKLSSNIKFNYFHLPEGSPDSALELRNYGKMLSYFVLDFIKCQNKLDK